MLRWSTFLAGSGLGIVATTPTVGEFYFLEWSKLVVKMRLSSEAFEEGLVIISLPLAGKNMKEQRR